MKLNALSPDSSPIYAQKILQSNSSINGMSNGQYINAQKRNTSNFLNMTIGSHSFKSSALNPFASQQDVNLGEPAP
jgi:hypothetical protein